MDYLQEAKDGIELSAESWDSGHPESANLYIALATTQALVAIAEELHQMNNTFNDMDGILVDLARPMRVVADTLVAVKSKDGTMLRVASYK